jgi:hypothetical protein
MLLHIYFCDDWFWPKLKRISNAFENLICKTLKIKRKENSFTFLSLSSFGPFGLLANSAGLLPLSSLQQAARLLSLGPAQWADIARSLLLPMFR